MIKLIAVVSMFALNAYALPFGMNVETSVENKPKAPMECADFSGDWIGMCSVEGHTSAAKLKIKQYGSCNSITLDNDEHYLSGVRTVVNSGTSFTETSSLMTRWKDSSKQRIEFTVVSTSHDFSEEEADSARNEGELFLVNDGNRLKMKGESRFQVCNDSPDDKKVKDCSEKVVKLSCIYDQV